MRLRFRPVGFRCWLRPVGFRFGVMSIGIIPVWLTFVTSATRLASLASINTAIVTSLATLAAIVISIIISIIITALATLASISVAVATLARLAIWFRFGVVWLGLIPSLRKNTKNEECYIQRNRNHH
jgi:hypothetical protein